ncbi:MAG TPA: hypothetical protein VFS08_14120 [Gemmatimonadaceae bacterium]|nr:hypothetical protein [Gemmatimonadaceae bacterium]
MPHTLRCVRPRASLLVGLALAACGGADDVGETAGQPAPTLTAVDSVVLPDTGALALGDVANLGLHVGDDAIWVADRQNGRLVRFARDGRPLAQVSRKGRGPGEIAGPGPLAVMGDGTVAVWDYGGNRVLGFAPDGALRWELPVREQALPLQLQATGDTLWAGVVSLADSTGVMRIVPRTGAIEKLARVPLDYTAGLAHSLPFAIALRLGDGVLVNYAGDHRLFLHRDDGGIDSIPLPKRLRRGTPPDLLARAMRGEYREAGGFENVVSMPARVARLTDGTIALLHSDVDFSQTEHRPPRADVWLTVLDAANERACVDAPLPRSDHGLPSLTFRGDTLFLLDQVIGADRATPVLRSFVVSTAGCAWMAVAHQP